MRIASSATNCTLTAKCIYNEYYSDTSNTAGLMLIIAPRELHFSFVTVFSRKMLHNWHFLLRTA